MKTSELIFFHETEQATARGVLLHPISTTPRKWIQSRYRSMSSPGFQSICEDPRPREEGQRPGNWEPRAGSWRW
jgi:hypothetical protein